MNNKRKCIFHLPIPLQGEGASASSIRPLKMLKAFKNIGYDVEVIEGYSDKRKAKIQELMTKVRNGEKYDFVYSESSTMPTMLTEKNHIPKHYDLDFNFFKFCTKFDIPVGLFYRDIHWKFPLYKEGVKGIKRHVAVFFYKHDLKQYKKTLKYLFVPTFRMCKYIEKKYLPDNIAELPPGSNQLTVLNNRTKKKIAKLKLLYIGGIGEIYQFDKLLEVACNQRNVFLTVCCRKDDWEKNKERYSPYLSNNISIVHKSGNELNELYDHCDVCMAFFKPTEYMAMAMPVKIFEYLSYKKPIIATNNTAAGEFVKQKGIGWSIDYDCDKLRDLLKNILNDSVDLESIYSNIEEQIKLNSWEKRAEQVAELLMN